MLYARTLCWFGLICLLNTTQAQSPRDSLLHTLPLAKDSARFTLLTDLVWAFRGDSLGRDMNFARESLALAFRLGDSLMIGSGWNNLVIAYYLDGALDSAMYASEAALVLRERFGTEEDIASTLSKMANILQIQGNYEAAIGNYLQLIEVYEALELEPQKRLTLQNLGALYNDIEAYDRGLEVNKDNMPYFQATGAVYDQGITFNNMGMSFAGLQLKDSAIWAWEQAEKAFLAADNSYYLGTVRNNLGSEWTKKGELRKAIPLLRRARTNIEAVGNQQLLISNLTNLGTAYRLDGQYRRALVYLDEAEELANAQDFGPNLAAIYGAKSFVYANLRNHNQAQYYVEQSERLTDSLNGVAVDREIARLETQFKVAEQARQIDKLADQQEINELQLRQQRLQIWGLIGLAGLLITGAILWIQVARLRRIRELEALKLVEQQRRLEAILQTQEREQERIARDLHDGIGQSLAATRMQLTQAAPASEPALTMLDEVCDEVRDLAHQMMPRALAKADLASAIAEMLPKSLGAQDIQYEWDHLGQAQPLSQANAIACYRIVQELISNVIKHSEATEVAVQMIWRKTQLTLRVEDNGKGLETDGTGGGMGLDNMLIRAEAIGAQFSIRSILPTGTEATLQLSLS